MCRLKELGTQLLKLTANQGRDLQTCGLQGQLGKLAALASGDWDPPAARPRSSPPQGPICQELQGCSVESLAGRCLSLSSAGPFAPQGRLGSAGDAPPSFAGLHTAQRRVVLAPACTTFGSHGGAHHARPWSLPQQHHAASAASAASAWRRISSSTASLHDHHHRDHDAEGSEQSRASKSGSSSGHGAAAAAGGHRARAASIDPKEAAKFAALAAEWWSPDGPFAPLHAMNPARCEFIRGAVCRALMRKEANSRCGARRVALGAWRVARGACIQPPTRMRAHVLRSLCMHTCGPPC